MKYIYYLIGFVATTITFWLAGFNFDERNGTLALWFVTGNVIGFSTSNIMIALKELNELK